MDLHDLILLLIDAEPGQELIGRTLLQKRVYVLAQMLRLDVRFEPHYYGPYSRDAARAVDSLVSAGLLTEHAETMPVFSTPWGDSTRYTYRLPEKVRLQIETLTANVGPGSREKLRRTLGQLNSQPEAKDYKSLSIAAKVHQILTRKGSLRLADFPKEAKRLGWNLSDTQVERAADFLQRLGLLKKN